MFDTTSPTAVLGLLVGGVMLLLYGVRLITDSMQHAAGARLRRATMALARRPFAAFGVGVLATALTQSSSATSSLLVGLVSAQLVPLSAAVVMALGTNVGSTLVVWPRFRMVVHPLQRATSPPRCYERSPERRLCWH